MLDILDRLQEEEKHVVLTMASGEKKLGLAHGIVWDEDDEGWETVKAIYFQPYGFDVFEVFQLGEIQSYEVVQEEDLLSAAQTLQRKRDRKNGAF